MEERNHNISTMADVFIKELADRNTSEESKVIPDWGTATTEEIDTPWGGKAIHAFYTDPLLHGYSVLIIADSVPEDYDLESSEWKDANGIVPERITTMTMRFPRCILPEVNTHRVFSRNSASSRARSFKTTIRPIMEDAYVPLFTKNMKGMGGDYVDKITYLQAARTWLDARNNAVYSTLELLLGDQNMVVDEHEETHVEDGKTMKSSTAVKVTPRNLEEHWEELVDRYMEAYKTDDTTEYGMPSIHKQNANRLLEPFMWHEALVTSTYWQNFLDLRIDDAAQPEIHALAILVKTALDASTPVKTWVHLPFGDRQALDMADDWEDMSNVLLAAASECARISYRDRSGMATKDDATLGRRLLAQKHMSPFEHIAFMNGDQNHKRHEAFNAILEELAGRDLTSNLSPEWIQYRRVISAREQ